MIVVWTQTLLIENNKKRIIFYTTFLYCYILLSKQYKALKCYHIFTYSNVILAKSVCCSAPEQKFVIFPKTLLVSHHQWFGQEAHCNWGQRWTIFRSIFELKRISRLRFENKDCLPPKQHQCTNNQGLERVEWKPEEWKRSKQTIYRSTLDLELVL